MKSNTRAALALLTCLIATAPAYASEKFAPKVFLRVQVVEPTGHDRLKLVAKGHRHLGPEWYLPETPAEIPGNGWSQWIDLSAWPWHNKMSRAGGVAEWCSVKLSLEAVKDGKRFSYRDGCALRVQLADAPEDRAVVHDFTERSAGGTIGFLVPLPLRGNAEEFETGSQMTARHRAWADEATGGRGISLKKFDICTSIWGHYDPALARQDLATLKQLGFNVVNSGPGLEPSEVREAGFRIYRQEWLYESDPRKASKQWEHLATHRIEPNLKTEEGRWEYRDGVTHWVLGDEIRALSVMGLDARELDEWFRDYLKEIGAGAGDDTFFGSAIERVKHPADDMHGKKVLPRDADLPTRRRLYHAAKFGHWWSAKQLRHSTNLIQKTLPGAKTETLPTDFAFFDVGDGPEGGMSWALLDFFELGRQRSVDQLSAEDWLGLNHMYGPNYTWSGAQSHAYFTAIMRSAVSDDGVMLRNLITPSDDKYLRLKAYSALGQGSKSFFFWTYGPTYIGTENYWSDLRSMYDGIAKLNRGIEQAEDVLHDAKVVSDKVAILYSVSHDIWNVDHAAPFVEKRLLWHALRHLGVQPDFLSEHDVEAGRLKDYKALYVGDWCVTRAASATIDEWVKAGGVAYLSAGAATRDEYYEPYVPPFAARAWGDDAGAAVKRLVSERHKYNERADLPRIQPMTSAGVRVGSSSFQIPVVGCRLDLATGDGATIIANFADGKPAGAVAPHGKGTVVALGFCPMLAYGQQAKFQPKTLEERWPAEPRILPRIALDRAGVKLVASADTPVVETSLLRGPRGHVLVLANYTYQPIDTLRVHLRVDGPVGKPRSTEGKDVKVENVADGIVLTLPLEWTDLVVIPNP